MLTVIRILEVCQEDDQYNNWQLCYFFFLLNTFEFSCSSTVFCLFPPPLPIALLFLILWNISLEFTWQANHTTLHDPWGRQRGEISILKYLEQSFENGVKLRPECLACDKRPGNVEEHGAWLTCSLVVEDLYNLPRPMHFPPAIPSIHFSWGHWETVSGSPGMSAWLSFKCY